MDWGDETCYAYLHEPPVTDADGNTTGMTPERWAWEFLRRNPDYRREWEELLARGEADEIMYREELAPDAPHLYVPASESQRWGLAVYCNPATPHPHMLRFPPSFGRIILGKLLQDLQRPSVKKARAGRGAGVPRRRWHELSYPLQLAETQAAVIFDLSRPLAPQWRDVAARLRKWQQDYAEAGELTPAVARNHDEHWPRYLQVLDAKADGVSSASAAAMLFSEYSNEYPAFSQKKHFDNALTQARKLVNGGYRKILLWPTA